MTDESTGLELTQGADALVELLNLGDPTHASKPAGELIPAREAGIHSNALDAGP